MEAAAAVWAARAVPAVPQDAMAVPVLAAAVPVVLRPVTAIAVLIVEEHAGDLVPHLVPAVAVAAHLVRQIALTIVETLVVHNALGWLLRQYINIKIKENDMRILKIEIDQETVNYIERLHYEVEQRKDIIQRLIEAHANDADATVLTSPAFRAYSSELSEFTAEYEAAKTELQKMYIPAYMEGHEIKWKLDFASRLMEIEILCNCEIPELEEKERCNR